MSLFFLSYSIADDTAPPDPWSVPAPAQAPATRYARFQTWTTADGLPSDHVTCAVEHQGVVWVGTDEGLAQQQGDGWRAWGVEQGLVHPVVNSLAWDAARGELWVATLGGLSRWSGGRFKNYLQTDSGLPNNVVYDVGVVGDELWAATAAGAGVLDLNTGTWRLYNHENTLMHEPWTYAVTAGPGKVWLGVWGGGVVEWDRATDSWKEYRDPDGEMEIDLMRDDGPIHEVTAFVAWDAGLLWQATYFGLSRYDGRRWNTWSKADSPLPSDFINMVQARGRACWLATDGGLAVFDGQTWAVYHAAPEGRGTELLAPDGPPGDSPAPRVMDTGLPHDFVQGVWPQQDHVWIATLGGLCRGDSR